MDNYVMVPPNQNSQMYRSNSPPPNSINVFLDFIQVKDGRMLIGTSDLNGRKWTGSLCYYKNYTDGKFNIRNMKTNHQSNSGITDGSFLCNSRLVIVSKDSGEIDVLGVTEYDTLEWLNPNTSIGHEDTLSEISVWENTTNFVTCAYDSTVRIWDFAESGAMNTIHNYSDQHSDIISSINAHPSDQTTFVTCSYDRTALLWDKRCEDRVQVIYENEFSNLTSIEFNKSRPNIVAVGNSAGNVYLVDVREPTEFISRNDYFKRSIHKTKFNSNGLLAVCADDSRVIILDCANEEMKLMYENDEHDDMVRGLTWNEDKLITCAWDQKVIFHK